MRVAITGVTGRLGGALARHHSRLGNEVIRLDRERLDLADTSRLADQLGEIDFEVLINPAALTSLEACEDAPALAQQINCEAPGIMAAVCRRRALPFLHVSTDYVFDGELDRPLEETDPANPINVYGLTKRAGEEAVLANHPGAWVARVSWVFGPEKASFIETMLGREARGEVLAAIDDKFSCPTHADDAAIAFDHLLDLGESSGGIVHVCNPGAVSWYDYARAIFVLKYGSGGKDNGPLPQIERLRLAEMKAFRAPRPRHTAMSVSKLRELTGHAMRPWQEAVASYIARLV